MKTITETFKFRVPKNHPEAGAEKSGSYSADLCEQEQEAEVVMAEQNKNLRANAVPWNLVSLVNDRIQALARAAAYQSATAPYRQTKMTPEASRERMITDLTRRGLTREVATQVIDNALQMVEEPAEA